MKKRVLFPAESVSVLMCAFSTWNRTKLLKKSLIQTTKRCCCLLWTNSGSRTLRNSSSCSATYSLFCQTYKKEELDILRTAGEIRMSLWDSFYYEPLQLVFLHWSLSNCKYPHILKTFPCILADLNSAVLSGGLGFGLFWRVSIICQITNSSSFFFQSSGDCSKQISYNCYHHLSYNSFFIFSSGSKYFPEFSLFSIFSLQNVKSTYRQILFSC